MGVRCRGFVRFMDLCFFRRAENNESVFTFFICYIIYYVGYIMDMFIFYNGIKI
jgi:hypothetical protein